MARITYADKVALNVNPDIADINKVKDTDLNQIKQVVNDNETKILLAVSDTAPAECSTGDVYYNTTTNLLYTATGTNTWGSTGVAPTENTIYILFNSQTAYAYDGTELVSVGGGSDVSDLIVVGTDTPTENTKLQIESNDLDPQGTYITNTHSESTTTGYSAAYSNKAFGGTILWTNPSPTATTFAAQSITLSSGDYDVYEIIYLTYGATEAPVLDSSKSVKGYGTNLVLAGYLDKRRAGSRSVSYTDATTLAVGQCFTFSSNDDTTDNSRCIPLYVLGYKTGLFS